MYCKNCGSQLRDDSRFCANCGASIPVAAAAPASPKEEKKKRSAASVLGIILLILLILLVISGIIYAVVHVINAMNSSNFVEQDEYVYEIEEELPVEETLVMEIGSYADCYASSDSYLLPESDVRYLTYEDIRALTPAQLRLACCEIEARHGATFDDPDIQEVFDGLSWYSSGGTVATNDIEQVNLTYLQCKLGLLDGSVYSGNPYMNYFDNPSSYILPGSQDVYLTSADLLYMSSEALTLARNEIYARHGYIFSSPDLQEYFCCKDWYSPSIPADDFDSDNLSSTEDGNLGLIKVYEKIAEGIKPAADNPYMDYYNDWYIFPDSASCKLEEMDLLNLTREELIIARNEIFARHGYAFSDDDLFAYFYNCSWYTPNSAPGRLDLISMNSTENYNVNFLLDHQERLSEVADLSKLNTSLSYDLSTDFFSLRLPKYFKDYCDIDKYYSSDTYYITFYDELSMDCMGGHAFTVVVMPSYEDYSYYPAYWEVGSIYDEGGNAWNIIVVEPTDVQACLVVYELYSLIAGEAYRIIDTLSPNSGYTFSYSMA